MKKHPILVGRNFRGTWLAAFVCVATSVAACGDPDGEDRSDQALCREGASTVVLTNDTGQPIRELQILPLEQVGVGQSLVDPASGLASGAEVGWVACTATRQALVITLADGTQQQAELPAIDPSTSRLRMTPGGVVVQPPPPTKPPVRGELQTDRPSTGAIQPLMR
jgi:hypothetical protein